MNYLNKIVLFSRDDRSFKLFRKSWILAINELKIPYSIVNRGFGFFKAAIVMIKFIRASKGTRIIFGTSEICLYSAFSFKHDIWVFTGLGRLLQYRGKLHRFVRFFLKCSYRQQKIIALNPQDVAYLEKIFPTRVILLNGEGFDFKKISRPRKYNSTKLIFAYVGRLLKSKGVDRFVEVFVRLPKLNCELRLIGDFDFSNSDAISAEWLAEMKSRSNNKIHHYGFINNVGELLNEVDVYISLSDREGLPFSVLEAIEAGCFIVLSPVPGHLSFANLDGIVFDEFKDLHITLESVLTHSAEYFNFDSHKRLKICNERFGMQTIITEIKSKIL